MRRFKPKTVFDIQEDQNGDFVLLSEAAEALQFAIMYAIKHKDDIENDINDFGDLKPVLAMAKSIGSVH